MELNWTVVLTQKCGGSYCVICGSTGLSESSGVKCQAVEILSQSVNGDPGPVCPHPPLEVTFLSEPRALQSTTGHDSMIYGKIQSPKLSPSDLCWCFNNRKKPIWWVPLTIKTAPGLQGTDMGIFLESMKDLWPPASHFMSLFITWSSWADQEVVLGSWQEERTGWSSTGASWQQTFYISTRNWLGQLLARIITEKMSTDDSNCYDPLQGTG